MGRTPKPKAVLEITGAAKRNPQRMAARAEEPVPSGDIGPPPAHWEKASSYPKGALEEIWNFYVSTALPGVLGNSDRMLLEQICLLTYESRRTGTKTQLRAISELHKQLKTLGMTPVDRARVHVRRPSELAKGSKLAEFQSRKKVG